MRTGDWPRPRQRRARRWSAAPHDGVAVLRTLLLNGGWGAVRATAGGAAAPRELTRNLFAEPIRAATSATRAHTGSSRSFCRNRARNRPSGSPTNSNAGFGGDGIEERISGLGAGDGCLSMSTTSDATACYHLNEAYLTGVLAPPPFDSLRERTYSGLPAGPARQPSRCASLGVDLKGGCGARPVPDDLHAHLR